MNVSHLAETIKSRREALGWSQRRLSKEAGLNDTAVKNIESGKSRSPRSDTLVAIAKALNCSLYDLLGEGAASEGLKEDKAPFLLASEKGASSRYQTMDRELLRGIIMTVETGGRLMGIKQTATERAEMILEFYDEYADLIAQGKATFTPGNEFDIMEAFTELVQDNELSQTRISKKN